MVVCVQNLVCSESSKIYNYFLLNYFGKNACDIVFDFNGFHLVDLVQNNDAREEILWEADKSAQYRSLNSCR